MKNWENEMMKLCVNCMDEINKISKGRGTTKSLRELKILSLAVLAITNKETSFKFKYQQHESAPRDECFAFVCIQLPHKTYRLDITMEYWDLFNITEYQEWDDSFTPDEYSFDIAVN